ncbi:MAG: hypothetical protein ABIZ80_08830, partial [Bryobacteraceae bacterium]
IRPLSQALTLSSKPRRATGWIAADSRYQLDVNGHRIQWGPAPSTHAGPKPIPSTLPEALQAGPNAVGATVLYSAYPRTWHRTSRLRALQDTAWWC